MLFALENPSPGRLIKALEMNDRAMALHGCEATGSRRSSKRGIAWVRDGSRVSLLFPRLRAQDADRELERFLGEIRRTRPRVPVSASVGPGCTPADIVARLIAFGFEIPQGGGLPAMASLLSRIPRRESPAGVSIQRTCGSSRTCRFEAFCGAAPVGRVFVLCAAGVAGIHDLKVEEEHRLRGIGSLLMEAACRWARERGFRTAVLTANPLAASLYTRFGFRDVGRIKHCHLPEKALTARPLTALQRRIFVAIYMGKLTQLESLARSNSHELVTPGGVTTIQAAAATRQAHVGEWLVQRGAAVDPLSAWDLGWKDRLRDVGRRDPGSLNRKTGGLTPLHQAILRRDTKVESDLALLIALLEAGADPAIEDDIHNSTPLGWSQAFHDTEAAELLTTRTRYGKNQRGPLPENPQRR